jgi:CRP-like cAMP-binding protein
VTETFHGSALHEGGDTADVLYVRSGPNAPAVIRWRRDRPFTIGRLPENALALVADPMVSRRHAEIRHVGGVALLTDPGSANGTWLNGEMLLAPTALADGDRIRIGDTEIVFNPAAALGRPAVRLRIVASGQAEVSEEMNAALPDDRTVVVGRGPDCDVVLADPAVAEMHATIQPLYGDYVLTDLGDAGGTFVNNVRLERPVCLAAGDIVRVGNTMLRFEPDETAREADTPTGAQGAQTVEGVLARIAPFSVLTPAERSAVAAQCEWVTVSAGHTLTEETRRGEAKKAAALYLLVEGRARLCGVLREAQESQAYTFADLSPGDFVGELALLDGVPYSRRLVATSAARLLCLTASGYRAALASQPSLQAFFAERLPQAGLRRRLQRTTLSRFLPTTADDALVAELQRVHFDAGQTLVHQGAACEQLFLLTRGWVRVEPPDGRRDRVLSQLGPDEYFGEAIAVEDVYPFTLVAETAGEAYTLSRADFARIVRADPETVGLLASGVDLVPPSVLLQKVAPFNALPPQLVQQTAAVMRLKTFRAGEVIVQQDDPASAFYIVKSGSVRVSFRTQHGEERPITTLGANQHFGEAALLTGEGRNATVSAAEDCTLWALYRAEFEEALAAGRAFDLGVYFREGLTLRSRPRRRDGVEVARQTEGGEESFMLRSANGESYLRLSDRGMFIWDLLDGDHTINDLCVAYFTRYQTVGVDVIAGTIAQLQALGFVEVPPTDLQKLLPSPHAPRWQQVATRLTNILTWRKEFPGADAWTERWHNRVGWIFFTRWGLLALAVVSVAGLAAFASLFLEIMQGGEQRRQAFNPWALLAIPVALLIITVLHEAGHAFTCRHYGRRVNSAGIGFAYLFPYAFVGTSDIWMAGRGARMAVSAAGPLVNVVTGSLCALVAVAVPDATVRSVLFLIAGMSYLMVLSNLHPFMELDGYYLLVDWLGIPSLRKRAMQFLRQDLWRCLRRGRFDREQRILALFGVGVLVFTLVMGVSLVLFLNGLVTALATSWFSAPVGAALGWGVSALVLLVFFMPFVMELQLAAPERLGPARSRG